ncbi:exodeoxyribonuclease VII small subunit [Candidatus Bipolaricaulota bacterium]|nr:exodeoxyribonuclease VII small subunit [Candidatus Bipolaricaulota bacterium]
MNANVDQALKRLEEIASMLEAAELPLEDTLALFEEGVGLATTVKTQLEQAKMRIRTVVENASGLLSLEDFDLS